MGGIDFETTSGRAKTKRRKTDKTDTRTDVESVN